MNQDSMRSELDAYAFLVTTDGWKYLERDLKAAIDQEVSNLAVATDTVAMCKSAGRIEALKRILTIPGTAIGAYKQELGLPVFDDDR